MLKWLTIAFATVLASSFLSMMAVFSGATGGDLDDLLNLQAAAIPAAIAAAVWSLALIARRHGAEAARTLWAELPGWLVLAVAVMLALAFVAELAFVMVGSYTGEPRPWREHVPVATAFTSALALASCYAALRLAGR